MVVDSSKYNKCSGSFEDASVPMQQGNSPASDHVTNLKVIDKETAELYQSAKAIRERLVGKGPEAVDPRTDMKSPCDATLFGQYQAGITAIMANVRFLREEMTMLREILM